MDLVDIGKYHMDNGGIYWILTAIKDLGRYPLPIPVYSTNTSNMTKAVTLLLKQFKNQFGDYPKLVIYELVDHEGDPVIGKFYEELRN